MTAIAIIRCENGIVVAADGAAYDREAVLRKIGSKIEVMTHLSCVMTCRGDLGASTHLKLALAVLAEQGEPMQDFDDVLAALPGCARGVHARCVTPDGRPVRFAVFVGGFSEARQRWETYCLRTYAYGGGEGSLTGEHPAFTLTPLPEYHLAPVPAEGWAPAGLPARIDETTDLDPYTFAIRAVCGCRVDKGAPAHDPDAAEAHRVGGFVEAVFLTHDAAESRVVHRWPDPLGEPITLRGDLLPEFLRSQN